MDLNAVRRINPPLSQNALNRVDRVKKTLEQAIDLKRRVIEELRPSRLDNFGLFAALGREMKRTWGNSEVVVSLCRHKPIRMLSLILSRVRPSRCSAFAREALSIVLKRASVKSVDLTVRVDQGNFWMRFR